MLYQLRSRWIGLVAVFDVGYYRLYSGVQRPIVAQVKFLVDGVNVISTDLVPNTSFSAMAALL